MTFYLWGAIGILLVIIVVLCLILNQMRLNIKDLKTTMKFIDKNTFKNYQEIHNIKKTINNQIKTIFYLRE